MKPRTSPPSYPILDEAIRTGLGAEWETPRQLCDRLQLWAKASVRHALRGMADRGECEVEARPLRAPLVSVNLYRRRQHHRVTAFRSTEHEGT